MIIFSGKRPQQSPLSLNLPPKVILEAGGSFNTLRNFYKEGVCLFQTFRKVAATILQLVLNGYILEEVKVKKSFTGFRCKE